MSTKKNYQRNIIIYHIAYAIIKINIKYKLRRYYYVKYLCNKIVKKSNYPYSRNKINK